jgi:hypothetical protein
VPLVARLAFDEGGDDICYQRVLICVPLFLVHGSTTVLASLLLHTLVVCLLLPSPQVYSGAFRREKPLAHVTACYLLRATCLRGCGLSPTTGLSPFALLPSSYVR